MTSRTCVAAAVLASVLVAAAASAAPGQLDPTFSGDGWVRAYDVRGGDNPHTAKRGVTGLALQPDGRIVTVGPLNGDAFGALRWLPNGDLDRGFGANGLAVARTGDRDEAWSAAVRRDGKVIVAGRGACRLLSCAIVARLLSDGRVDSAFGRGGVAVADRVSCPAIARDVALQRDGKIVVAGWRPRANDVPADLMLALARFTPNGRLDRTFSRDGCVSVDFSSLDDRAYAVTVQPDGRIVAAGVGSPRRRTVDDFAFVRLRRNGTLDRTFSGDGLQTVDFGQSDTVLGIALQPNGRLVGVGLTGPSTTAGYQTAAVVRLRRDGTVDRTFGVRGRVLLRASRVESYATDVALAPSGAMFVVGGALERASAGSSSDWFLARLRSDGRLDRSWAGAGLVLGNFGTGEDWAGAVALQRDGKIVVGGQVYIDQALARYLAR